MSFGIVVKNYAHVNRSLPNWDTPQGRIVKSKEHYERLCKENNMVPFEQAEEIAAKARKANIKDYKVSKDSMDLIKSVKFTADKNGNVKLGDRAIDALIAKKAIGKKIPSYMKLPSVYNGKGGFNK